LPLSASARISRHSNSPGLAGRPHWPQTIPNRAGFRKALLLGIAFAADFGGMGTPIGSGPKLIAIGAANAIAPDRRITFAHWILFVLPLTVLMLALSYLLLAWLYRVRGAAPSADIPRPTLAALSIIARRPPLRAASPPAWPQLADDAAGESPLLVECLLTGWFYVRTAPAESHCSESGNGSRCRFGCRFHSGGGQVFTSLRRRRGRPRRRSRRSPGSPRG
jgi:hypothetical protein